MKANRGEKEQKGQVAIEVLSFSAVFLLAFIVVLVVVNLYGQEEHSSTMYMLANELAMRLSSAVTTVYSVGEGFSYKMALPPALGSYKYFVILKKDPSRESTSIFVVAGPTNTTAVYSIPLIVECKNGGGTNACRLNAGREYTIEAESNKVVIE